MEFIRELAVKYNKIYAAQIDALPSSNGRQGRHLRGAPNRCLNVGQF